MSSDPPDSQPAAGPGSPGPGPQIDDYLLSHCNHCGVEAETKYAEFRSCVSVGVVCRISTVRGHFCRRCRDRCFWHHTNVCLAMGWWAIDGVLLNPLIIASNLYHRVRTRGLAPVDEARLAAAPFPLDEELDSTTADTALGDPDQTSPEALETEQIGWGARAVFLAVVGAAVAVALWQIPSCISGPRGHEVAVDRE